MSGPTAADDAAAPAEGEPAAPARSPRARALRRIALSVAIAAALLALLMLIGDVRPRHVAAAVRKLPPGAYAAALGVHVAIYLLRALRFNVLLPREWRPRYRRMLAVSSAHNLASYVLPAKTGEASFLVYLRAQSGVPASVSFASLLVSRLLDGATLCAGLAAACLWLARSGEYPKLTWLGSVGAALFGMCLLFAALCLRGDLVVRLAARGVRWVRLHRWRYGEHVLAKTNALAVALRSAGAGGRLYLAALATAPIWLGVFAFYAVLARAMGMASDLSFAEATFGSSLAVLFNLLPVNGFAGAGTQESGWVLGFAGLLGVDRGIALSTGLGVHLVQLFNVVVLGLLAHLVMGAMPRIELGALEEEMDAAERDSMETPPVTPKSNQEIQIELHRELAPRYAYRYSLPYSRLFQEDWHAEMISHVPAGATEVLDIGCGTGFFLAELARAHPGAVGLDISFDMLRVSEQYVPGARVVTGDAMRLPFQDARFDAVFCKGSLHHVRDHVAFLESCRRVLRPGGVLVMSEPCNDNPIIRGARRAMYRRSRHFDEGDEGFTKSGLLSLCDRAGFDVEAVKKYGVLAYVFAGFPDHLGLLRRVPGNVLLTRGLLSLDRAICRIPGLSILGFHVVVVVRPRASARAAA